MNVIIYNIQPNMSFIFGPLVNSDVKDKFALRSNEDCMTPSFTVAEERKEVAWKLKF